MQHSDHHPRPIVHLLQPATVLHASITAVPCIKMVSRVAGLLGDSARVEGYLLGSAGRAAWRRGGSGGPSPLEPRGGAGPRRVVPVDGRCTNRCQVGCPKTPVKGKMPSKGSRRVGPTEVPAMRYPHNHPPLSRTNERSTRCLRREKRGHHRENFTGCTRRPCSKRRRGSCPSSPARCRSSPRNVRSHQHRHLTR